MSIEVAYKPVTGADGYWVGNDGSVWSEWKREYGCGSGVRYVKGSIRTLLQPGQNSLGYCIHRLRVRKGKYRSFFAHRMVLEHFVSMPKVGQVGRHLDGNKLNNHVNNLAWGTQVENMKDRARHGRALIGEKNPNTKFTRDQAIQVKALLGHMPLKTIATNLKVSIYFVQDISRGRTWRHV